MQKPPIQGYLTMPREWVQWFNRVWEILTSVDDSGTTAQRPTVGLFVGRPYFDTTLGQPIWLKSVTPTVWVTADGIAA